MGTESDPSSPPQNTEVNESRRWLGGQVSARTALSAQAASFGASLASERSVAGGTRVVFGCSKATVTVTPIARPFCTAVLVVTFAFEGTRHRASTPFVGCLEPKKRHGAEKGTQRTRATCR